VNSLQFGLATGRVSSIAFDPSDTVGNHVFVGTTGGGLWGSQNAAATNASSVQFLPLTDNLGALSGASQAGISVGAVTVQPGGTGVVLAGLGDPSDALDSYYGAGLLRSADGGQTWTLIQGTVDRETGLGSQDFSFVGEGFAGFAWSTSNVQLVVAAVSQAYEGTLVNARLSSSSYEGLYWSNDGGATWHLARITDLNGGDVQGPQDGFVLPDGNAATSVVWNPVRQVFIAAVRYHGYYQSADGMNWTQLPYYPAGQPGAGFTAQNCPTQSGSVGVEGCPVFRGSLAVNPTTGDTFAWSVDAFNQDQGIWQDQCKITGFGAAASCGNTSLTFGVQLGTGPLETSDGNGPATIENGDYNLSLAAAPSGQDTLLLAGDNDLWKCSLANSCVWRNTTNATTCRSGGVGEYQHGLAWSTGNPLLLFAGTDSGLWRSLDDVGETGSVCAASDASHWQNMNGSLGSLAEVESLGEAASSPATMLAGLGANGTAGIVGAPAQAGNWNEVLGGEGGTVAVDPTVTANSWYVNNAAGVSIFHCSQSAACTAAQFGTTPVIGEAQVSYDGLSMPYPAAIQLDPVSPAQMLIGTCRVWRGQANGSGWSSSNAISPALDGSGSTVCNGNALIRSLAAAHAPGGGEVIYAGMAGTADGGGSVAGHVFMASISAGGSVSSWQDLTYSPVTNNGLAFNAFGQDVSGLYADTHDTTGQTVYAAIATFSLFLEPAQRLYRSTDGGAHWTSVTSNLPNAPANAVAVDSQDPNTVYVATDVGVYSTRAIATCGPGTSCWTVYGTGLPMSPVTALVATPLADASQVLTAGTYGRGIWQIPTATVGSTLTTYSVSPTALAFASQAVGTVSAAQTVTLKNTGSTALTVSGASFTGAAASDFTETDTCAGVALATNATCALKVTFAPAQTGSRTAQMEIQGNVSGGQVLIGLTGTAAAGAAVTLLPASLSFGTQQVGTTSASQTVNVQNQGGVTASLSTITVSAPFKKVSTTCANSLAAASACSVVVAFAPTAAGAASGTLTITGALGTQTALLSGTGLLAATDTLSTTSLNFAATTLGQISPPLTVTITNSGGYPLTGIGTSVSSSTGNPDFVTVNNCGSQLAANSSCGITVTFVPSANLMETGTMVISDALRAQPVSLRGAGLRPAVIVLSLTAVSYGGQQVGLASAAKTFTLSNTGQSTMNQPSFSFSGPGGTSFSIGTTTCSVALVSGGHCTFQVIFTPVASGATTATLTVGTSTPGVTAIPITLTGTGLSLPMLGLSPTALNLGTVLLGDSSAPLTVQITNTGQIAMTQPTFAVSGIAGAAGAQLADFAESAPTDIAACTGTLNPGASCNVQVTFSPSVAGTESATLTVSASNASPPMATVSLTGTGQAPVLLQSNQAALNFLTTAVGTTSAAQTVTLSNLSSQSANSLALSVAGPYSIVPALTTCAARLAASSSCTVGLTFTPTASGNQPGTLTATVSNLGVAPLVIPLDGSGSAVGGITVNPTQMAFGSVVVRVASAVQTLTVTNSGAAALTGLTISTTGDFTLTGNQCPASLAAGLSCTAGVGFTPSTTGLRSGTLSVNTSSAGVPPAVVPLTGNGIPSGSMAVNPPVLSFGTVSVGQTSPSQTVTVTNDGATTLAGLTYQLAGDYSLAQNGCGTQLASGAFCTAAFTFSPSGPGTRIGSLTIGSTTTGFIPVVIGLTGTGLPTVQLVVTPVQLTFGAVALGSNSAAQQLTVSNPGTGTLQGLSFATTAPFSVGTGSCGSLLLPGGTCQAPVIFAPAAGGSQNGTVTVSTTSLGVAAVQVPVTGSGLAPASLSLSPATITFPGTATGIASAAQTITVSNPGGGALSGLSLVISGAASGDFAIHSTSCAGTLTAGGSCSIAVVFTPSLTGGRQAVLTASSTTAGVASATAILNGTGLAAAGLSIAPAQLSFATTLVGQATATQVVTVTDSGQAAISNLQLAVTSGFALDPAKTTCTAALNGGASCQAGVVFVPATAGAITGSITASSALAGGTGTLAVTAPLTGTGALPPGIVASPAALVQFGTTGVGLAAQPVPVKFTNQGGLSSLTGFTLTLSSTATASGFGVSSNTCGPTLAAAASCTVNVTLTPTGYGPLTGTLVAASTNGGTPVTLQLAGIGFDFRLAIAGSNSASVTQGQSANYTLALTALGGSTAASESKFSFQCDNLPANAICVFNPPQLTVPESNVTGNDALSISTVAPTTGAVSDKAWSGAALALCALLGLPLGWRRRKSRLNMGWLSALMLAGAICGLSSCAGAGGSTGSGGQSHLGGGTPQGTYNITVTASANNVVHSATVVLVVN
jgi:hypothetical protein